MTEEQTLKEFFSEDTKPEPEPVSRRQFLAGAVVGGAAGLAAAAGTGAAVWKTMEAETQASLESAEADVELTGSGGATIQVEEHLQHGRGDALTAGRAEGRPGVPSVKDNGRSDAGPGHCIGA